MAPRKFTRKYPLTDAELKQRGDGLLSTMTRDAAELATRNIGPAEHSTLATMLEDFANMPDELESRGFITAMVERREEVATSVRRSISAIRIIAESRYGTTGKYRRFGFTNMHSLNNDGLHRLARRVIRIGTELLPELATRGLTADMLSALEALNADFDEAIEAVHDANAQSELNTEARITQGNAIWATMINYSLAGKGLFQDSDPARYRHYILEESR